MKKAERSPLLILLGPTAVGKTAFSLELAVRLGTDIISGDSMLVYRGLDIGTAKPTAAERAAVPHHLIDILDADEPFSVTDFVGRAAVLIRSQEEAGKLPFVVGGTGLYIKALIEGYNFNETPEHERFRRRLQRLAERYGNAFVHALLARRDPETAARLHVNDVRRAIRALEVVCRGGERISQERALARDGLVYDAFVIGLMRAREHLYARIDARVEAMFAAGLPDEVRALAARGVGRGAPAMKGIGYKETAAYLAGEMSEAAALEQVQKATRHFAKRQMTWYRKMPYIRWYDADARPEDALLRQILADVEIWREKRERGFLA
ncbi:tRNA (adenosine(37)-N6)-dimethylallyltransferase MiaA [Selenomonas sp. F0473]|uniref:tRNA (adenosine(37)-N6)-dimethylallyltransferase MiaA n=1 Tax=Selenomonas sp. F0473 TaxID=999423 RepID=UPI00029E5EA0|nr:tRNA (adenosine(37)-N6)-dimethylallyltransferase MiaA [Selenomonas sp. F0473]EKU71812.1 tRNA dimethylallyltransferase [Selenomonas sp. F0473]